MQRHLVIGHLGQIGAAIHKYLGEHHEVCGFDAKNAQQPPQDIFDVLHICIPFSESFHEAVQQLQQSHLITSGLTIIHSTIPVGTTDALTNAVHSPMRGVHPNLYEGLKTFTKFFGGERAQEAAKYFPDITTQITQHAATTEAAKLWDTTAYGLMIILEKEIHAYCAQHNLDFAIVYTQFTESYNTGYTTLNMPQVVRPVLTHKDGPIGGHCVMPNLELLGGHIAAFIKERNQAHKEQAIFTTTA